MFQRYTRGHPQDQRRGAIRACCANAFSNLATFACARISVCNQHQFWFRVNHLTRQHLDHLLENKFKSDFGIWCTHLSFVAYKYKQFIVERINTLKKKEQIKYGIQRLVDLACIHCIPALSRFCAMHFGMLSKTMSYEQTLVLYKSISSTLRSLFVIEKNLKSKSFV